MARGGPGVDDSTKKTPKKRQRRKEARPDEIIAAAIELWKLRGFAATRLEDVAAGAGVAKGTIYRYFSSKEALFEAAVEARIVRSLEQAKQSSELFEGTTEEALLAFFEKVRREMVDGGSFIFLKVLISEGHRFPDLVERYEATVLRRGVEAVRRLLLRGVERGELKPEAASSIRGW